MTTSHKQQHGTIMQLSPEGEVNSGGYISRGKASRYISSVMN